MASPDLRKRILFIGPVSPPVTGQSLACDILIDGLRNDYVFDIVNLSRDPDSQGNSAIRHILSSLGRVVRVWKLKSRCDLIYFTGAESIGGNLKDLLFYIACIGKLDHVVMHLHGGAGMRRLMRGRTGLFRWLNYPFLSRFGAVIVLGERMRDIFRGAVRPERLKFVANFAEAAHFSTHDDIDAKFDSDGPLCMLFLSNPLPGKGHVEIVEAFAGLDPLIRQKLRVDFAGRFFDANDEARFRQSIAPFEELRYLGTVFGEPKRAALAAAHLFLLLTYYPYEGQPISILEAFASGCVVVTTDHSGIFDTFTNGVNGYSVEKKSAAALRELFGQLASRTAEMREIAHATREPAKANFTTERFLSDLHGIIEQVARRST